MAKSNAYPYEQDFYAWALENARLLRQGDFAKVDICHVAEELEDMGKSEKRELINRLAILLAHLLKWEFQPQKRSNSWRATIKHQRLRVKKLLQENPSLKSILPEHITDAHEDAILLAAQETGLAEEDFPKNDAYTLEQLLNDNFFPE